MLRRLVTVIIFLMLAAAAAGCGSSAGSNEPHARGGVLDLTNWSFRSDGPAALQGEWLFFPHLFTGPDNPLPARSGHMAEVPGSWNNNADAYGFDGGIGYGTYRLLVLTNPEEPTLSIRVPNLYTAYRLWVNGVLTAARGETAETKDEARPAQAPRIASFVNPPDGRLELVLEMSNFHHRRGGISGALTIGPTPDMIVDQTKRTAHNMAIFGSLVIIGLYHVMLFVKRREEPFTLWFGLLCLLIGIRVIVTGEMLLVRYFPHVSWEAGLKIDYTALSLSALSGYMYVYALFSRETSQRIANAVIACSAVLCGFVLLCPAYVYTKYLLLFQLFIVAVTVCAVHALVKAALRRRRHAGLVLAGVCGFTLTILNDMFYYNEWVNTTELVPLGLLFFILMQAILLSSRFSEALRSVETVSAELRELNAHLEDRIEERTEELKRINAELEASYARLERVERSRRRLLANISHDLRTPMTLIQGYLEAMQDGVVRDPEKQSRYVRMMLGKIGGLNRLIGELFELSKLESGEVPLAIEPVRAAEWARSIIDRHALDIETNGRRLMVEPPEGEAADAVVSIDASRMDQVLTNVFHNAVRHTDPGGRITVRFEYDRDAGRLIVETADDGTGIDPEDLPYLFDRFYKKDKARKSSGGGSGIGLAIVKEIVELHGGRITAANAPGGGAVFRISLPVQTERPADN